MSDYSEVTQLQTQCTILESQLNVLRTQNAELQKRVKQLEKSLTPSYKEIPNVGKFPVGPIDDGDFQI
jgi:chaperonin cofactor prefoldin